MKKIFLFFASLTIGSASMVSCTDLSEETYSVIPSDKFFNDEEEFLMSAGRIYAYLVRYTCYRCIWGTITDIDGRRRESAARGQSVGSMTAYGATCTPTRGRPDMRI